MNYFMMKQIKSMVRIGGFFLAGMLLTTCSSRLKSWYATAEDIEVQGAPQPEMAVRKTQLAKAGDCYNAEYYIPDTNHLDHTPLKYIRVNVHFVNARDSAQNWPQDKALEFARGLLHAANYNLENNRKMFLPLNNDTPVLPTRFRYLLSPDPSAPGDSGVYRHFDDELSYYVHRGKNANLFDREVIRKYQTREDSVLNIFILPHHPDSIASKTYQNTIGGVALGQALKLCGVYEHGPDFWKYRGVLNHETGHILGLAHAWTRNDGCDDTPSHANNCWGKSEDPPCDTEASNNVMDYNAYQHAWTPCQIGRVHYRMAQENNSVRKLLAPNWCERNPDRDIVIRDTAVWRGAKDLEGNLAIADGGQLTIHCRVSIPAGGKITVEPGGVLILDDGRLHNACGRPWLGIEIQEQGGRRGRLVSRGEPQIEQVGEGAAGETLGS